MNLLHYIKNKVAFAVLAALAMGISITSCVDNDADDNNQNFYTAKKFSAAQFLENNPERYSMFKEILSKANCFNMLATYGDYTLFAPTNDAVSLYLKERGYKQVSEIPSNVCDTIAYAHIVQENVTWTSEQTNGLLGKPNMNDRFLELSCDSDKTGDNISFVVYVNKRSKLIQRDDTVTNGVVHTIDRLIVESQKTIGDLIMSNPKTQIFAEALRRTGFRDSLMKCKDETYHVSEDSSHYGISKHYGNIDWNTKYPENRYYKYTALIETDSVFKESRFHINNIDDLIKHAKSVFDVTFEKDKDAVKEDAYTDPRHPLNRWVRYHFIEGEIGHDYLCPSGEVVTNCIHTDLVDPEAFWQTMCNGAMIRFSRPMGYLYANRTQKNAKESVSGIRVMDTPASKRYLGVDEFGDPIEQAATNGRYYILEGVLDYNKDVTDKVLNCRMRIDATTLSPDFWNAGACAYSKGRNPGDVLTSFKNGYIRNWKTSRETYIGVRSENFNMWSYLGNAICVLGQYDIEIKLPQPPPGTYEVRLGYVAGGERGVVQVYMNNVACGIPIDLRRYYVDEMELADKDDDPEYNASIDKALHNIGYMKGMDSYGNSQTSCFRKNNTGHMRRILTTYNFNLAEENWLRFKQAIDGDLEFSIDYIELCPKSVYASPEGEDQH